MVKKAPARVMKVEAPLPPKPEFRAIAREPEPEPLPPVKEAETRVPVGSLDIGQLIEVDGAIFRIDSKEDNATLSIMEWDPSGTIRIPRWQRPIPMDTLVKQVT